jgi:hypothetical protein
MTDKTLSRAEVRELRDLHFRTAGYNKVVALCDTALTEMHKVALMEKRKEEWRSKAKYFGRKSALQDDEIRKLTKERNEWKARWWSQIHWGLAFKEMTHGQPTLIDGKVRVYSLQDDKIEVWDVPYNGPGDCGEFELVETLHVGLTKERDRLRDFIEWADRVGALKGRRVQTRLRAALEAEK